MECRIWWSMYGLIIFLPRRDKCYFCSHFIGQRNTWSWPVQKGWGVWSSRKKGNFTLGSNNKDLMQSNFLVDKYRFSPLSLYPFSKEDNLNHYKIIASSSKSRFSKHSIVSTSEIHTSNIQWWNRHRITALKSPIEKEEEWETLGSHWPTAIMQSHHTNA